MRQQVRSYRMLGWISRIGVILLAFSTISAQATVASKNREMRYAPFLEMLKSPGTSKMEREIDFFGDLRDGLGTELGSGKEDLQAEALKQGVPVLNMLEDILSTYLSRELNRVYSDGGVSWRLQVSEMRDVVAASKDLQREMEKDGWEEIRLGRYRGIKIDQLTNDGLDAMALENFKTKFLFGNMLVNIEMRGRAVVTALSPAAEMMNRLTALRLMN